MSTMASVAYNLYQNTEDLDKLDLFLRAYEVRPPLDVEKFTFTDGSFVTRNILGYGFAAQNYSAHVWAPTIR